MSRTNWWRQASAQTNPWTMRAAGLLALLALAALLLAVSLGYRTWQRYDNSLHQLEPRSQRIDGIVRAQDQIEKRLAAAQQAVAPRLHPGSPNDITQRLRELVVEHQAKLVSSQVVPIGADEQPADGSPALPRVRLNATITGSWAEVMAFLAALQNEQPPFWVSSATLMREGSDEGTSAENARLALQVDAPMADAKAAPEPAR